MGEGWFSFQRGSDALPPGSLQSSELDKLFLEDPSIPITAAWCISAADQQLVYFWGDRRGGGAASSDWTGAIGYCFRKFLPYFVQIQRVSRTLLSGENRTAAMSPVIKYLKSETIASGPVLDIFVGRGHLFIYQLRASATAGAENFHALTFLLSRSELGYHIARQAEGFFDRIPKEVLKITKRPDKLLGEYFGPNCLDFAPGEKVPFSWPWQRSTYDDGISSVRKRHIPTISLVMDLRCSSSALLLSVHPERFVLFIDEMVEDARNIVTGNGGYFDNDTGDGMVGHFEVLAGLETDATPLRNALTAARLIMIRTTERCARYQGNLNFHLGGLGCAVGLYLGGAVWLYSWRGVRAIGESVVNAARICANARAGEVGYCNTIAQRLRPGNVGAEDFPYAGERRPVKISEIRESAGPEATFSNLL